MQINVRVCRAVVDAGTHLDVDNRRTTEAEITNCAVDFIKPNANKQDSMYDVPEKLPLPRIINLLTDRKEERDVAAYNTWVANPMMKIIGEFEASLKKYPLIKLGTPDP